jgi:transposase
MRQVREVLRLNGLGLSARQIARSLKIGRATVADYLRRAKAARISWPLPADLDDAALEKLLFVPKEEQRSSRPLPDWKWIHTELKKKHVTLALLWEEYKGQQPDGYQYSQFCDLYRRWTGTLECWMRQEHRGGEKLFVDYSGDGIPWIDLFTGERREAQLFVAVLGASNLTYAEATHTQQLPDWINCHVHALEYFDGVVAAIVPDQARTAISSICRYDPETNPSYAEFARHYDTCILPARPARPRDKAKVEVGVLIAQRWIIAALRNRTFHSLKEINEAVAELVEKLNHRKMRKFDCSRHELYLQVDKPNLKPLPEQPYELADWKIGAGVNIDYHVLFEENYYSVPFQHFQKKVDIRATVRTVEIFFEHKRIATHGRLCAKYQYSTQAEHMPRSHREHAEWKPSRIISWAQKVGLSTAKMVETIIAERPHPEQGFRACLGLLRLGQQHSDERLEKACKRALACHSHSYRSVKSILEKKLEDQPLPEFPTTPLPHHKNVRGSAYYN